jgi:quinol monooxygenase YgiN
MSQSEKVAVIAKLTANPGQRAELAEAVMGGLSTALGEAGTEYYILHEDATDENVLWMYELYTDQAALATHGTSDGLKAMGMASRPFAASRPEIIFLKPLAGKGL